MQEPTATVGPACEAVAHLLTKVLEDDMSVHIDCDTCAVRGLLCHDCVVSTVLGPPPELAFDEEGQRALRVLADSGLVPPLRMVHPVAGPDVASA